MIKNVVVVGDYGYVDGGATKIAQETAICLKNAGLDVTYFCCVAPISEELTNCGIKTVCLNQSDILHEKNRVKGVFRGLNNKKSYKAFKELLSSLNPAETIVHVHGWTKAVSGSIFKAIKKMNFKAVITVHDYFLICPNGGLYNYVKKEICSLKPMSFKCKTCNCDARSYPQKLFRVLRQKKQNKNILKNKDLNYIFISKFAQNEFEKRYDKIDDNHKYFLHNPVVFSENRERIKCEENSEYLFIGRLVTEKGIEIFCDAVKNANVSATVIGDGELKQKLTENYPQIKFVGWKSRSEIDTYLKKARCLIFPSLLYETFGLVPLEAMAYGIPVICPSACASSDFIQNDKTGFLFSGNANSLAEAIEKTKDNEIIKNTSCCVFETFDDKKFSKKHYTENLINIYNEILK